MSPTQISILPLSNTSNTDTIPVKSVSAKVSFYTNVRGSAVETWKNFQSVILTETLENGLVSGRC